jgi:hypothetical protein
MDFSMVDNFERILLAEAGVFQVCNQDAAMTFWKLRGQTVI